MVRKFIREPLFHFVLLGAVLFLVAGSFRTAPSGQADKIVIGSARINELVAGFSRTWRRPPSQEELSGLVDEYVREEVFLP